MNIDKYRVTTHIRESLSKIYEVKAIISCKKCMQNVKNQHVLNWTNGLQLSSCCAFYIGPNCIRNFLTKFEIDRTILTYLN